MQNPPKKLLEQVRDIIRLKHYSYRTEETYVQWIVRYILFHNKRHPKEMGVPEIEEFLTHLAVEGNVAAATQNQALNAILFLYRQVLQIELADRINAIRAKRPQQIPIVLSPDEAFAIIQQTTGVHRLMLQLLYGSGLRLRECMELRIKDIDFAQSQLVIRCGKGGKDRVTLLPQSVIEPLQIHIQQVRLIHQQDLQLGYGVYCPLLSIAKIPMLPVNGFGNMSFPRQLVVKIPEVAGLSGFISMKVVCRKLSKQPCEWLRSPSGLVAIHSVIHLLPTCFKVAMTFALFKNY
jgi:integrase